MKITKDNRICIWKGCSWYTTPYDHVVGGFIAVMAVSKEHAKKQLMEEIEILERVRLKNKL
jgi:hypothetical protein